MRSVDLTKDFNGKAAVAQAAAEGPKRKLIGLEMVSRGIARDGYKLFANGMETGYVTSGGPSPTLGKNIAMGYVQTADAVLGRKLEVEIRGQMAEAVVVPIPFYKRPK
jgi:aminomethyltransferase